MFNKIWKEQIVQPTSKVGIFKPKQGFELEEDDDDCNKKLEEYANKIKNTRLPFMDSWDSKEFEHYRDFFTRKNLLVENFSRHAIYFWTHDLSQYVAQSKQYRYNPVPENVACETLEMLKKHTLNSGSGDPDDKEIDGYSIRIQSDNHQEFGTYLDAIVVHDDKRLIVLRLEHDHHTAMRKDGKSVFSFEKTIKKPSRSFWDASRYFFNIDWR